MRVSKITRKYERLLFKGIPEQPEHTWERNDHVNENVSMRVTGKSQSKSIINRKGKMKKVGTYRYDHKNEKETYNTNLYLKKA